MYDEIHGEGSAESAMAQMDWQSFTRQRKAQCSQETTHGQMQQGWVRRNGTECMSGHFIVSWHS